MKQAIKCPKCEQAELRAVEGNSIVMVLRCRRCRYDGFAVRTLDGRWRFPSYGTWAEENAKLKEENLQREEKVIASRKPRLRLRFRVFQRDKYRCQICGRDIGDGVKLELGHKKATAKGGKAEMDNLAVLCFDCNRGMGTDEM